MKKSIIAIGSVLLSVLLSPLKVTAATFDRLYIFGDSLSDNGNIFNVSQEFPQLTGGAYPPSPPYFAGHFSNGPIWVEYLSQDLGLPLPTPVTTLSQTQLNGSIDFAFGGAGSGAGNTVVPLAPPQVLPGLQTQVTDFKTIFPQADPNALYTVWSGADDYLFGRQTNPNVTVDNITTAITNLAAAGARNFIVPNLPDLGQLPATRGNSTLTQETITHDSALANALASLKSQDPTLNITLLDVYSAEQQQFQNGQFLNVTDACLANNGVPCSNPQDYFFWDTYHPTTAVHRIIANLAEADLNTQTVPEPSEAVGLLAFGAFGALWMLHKRYSFH
ncbi:MAG: SGNH/GDSL hydrolase family protein [Chroococcidiopsidaceae cyanobacterium CP_BM_RX_35]|nr:SGNH/GDSL hydrolase family protein [Chroococcidiopsidaceae cyanobacterium CP_BM_RX_35]